MNYQDRPGKDAVSASLLERVGQVCQRLEQAWQAGEKPGIEEYLAGVSEPERSVFFQRLLGVELELRHESGETIVPQEEYRNRFPNFAQEIELVFGQALALSGEKEGHDQYLLGTAGPVPRCRGDVAHTLGLSQIPSAGAAQPAECALKVPAKFGRYTIVRLLGTGGMGSVYLARDDNLERNVALKVPKLPSRDSQAVRRFLREARAGAALQHPNICPVYDVGESDGTPYLTMAYIEGRPLSKAFSLPLPERDAANLVRQLALALAEAHKAGIVHRDLKPANIMIAAGNKPIIMDFGLALRLVPGEGRDSLHGMIMGTPSYMAPEQAAGDLKQVGILSDVYSLGVILYELLAGRPPFVGDVARILAQLIRDEPQPPSTFRSDVDGRLEEICLTAMAKDMGSRFSSMTQFAEALAVCLDGAGDPLAPPVKPPKPDPVVPLAPPLRIALLYKRYAQPDGDLLKWLEKEFTDRGHHIFVDRHMAIGVEWAKELERQVRSMDAVVLLLSAASVQSEMLSWEIQIAHDEAEKRAGKPVLLPVRINSEAPLPAELAALLQRRQYFLWQGHQDNQRLLAELSNALRNPTPLIKIPPPGGVMALDTEHYVPRPTDDAFQNALARRDSVILIRGARQMGKTSLLARGLHRARLAGAKVIVTDFQRFDAIDLSSLERLYHTLGRWIADDLDLTVAPEDVWDARRGPSVNFERYIRREVLAKLRVPLIWAMDEVDRLFPCPFGSEVFGLFRSWHNARVLDPTLPWSQLTLAIAYATEAHLFISDMNQSPFNIGTLVALEDFSKTQVAELNRCYGSPLKDADLTKFFHLMGGQPYLVNRGLYEIVQKGLAMDTFMSQADRDDGIFGDHLRRILVVVARDPDLSDVVRAVLRGEPCASGEKFLRLRSAGVLTDDAGRQARLRCRLYANYLQRHLL